MENSDFYDFGGEFAQTYKAPCQKCGAEIEVSTQRDRDPEYYLEVYVKCKCGGAAKFTLPVN